MSCPICGTRETCHKCKGSGVTLERNTGPGPIQKEVKCPHCDGTGKCPNNRQKLNKYSINFIGGVDNKYMEDKKPETKDFVTVIVTVSGIFLALTPVFLVLVPTSTALIPHANLIGIYVAFAICFACGLFTIGTGVDWFIKPEERKKWPKWAYRLLIAQTIIFSASSFYTLFLTVLSKQERR